MTRTVRSQQPPNDLRAALLLFVCGYGAARLAGLNSLWVAVPLAVGAAIYSTDLPDAPRPCSCSSSSSSSPDRSATRIDLTGLTPLSPAATDNRPAKFFDHRFLLR